MQAKTIGGLAAAVLAFVAVAGSLEAVVVVVVGSGSLEVVVGSGSLEVVVVVVVVAGSGSLEAAAVVAAFVAFAAFSTAAAVKTAAAVQGSNLLKTEELGREGVAFVVALVALVEPGSRDASLRQIWKQNYSF